MPKHPSCCPLVGGFLRSELSLETDCYLLLREKGPPGTEWESLYTCTYVCQRDVSLHFSARLDSGSVVVPWCAPPPAATSSFCTCAPGADDQIRLFRQLPHRGGGDDKGLKFPNTPHDGWGCPYFTSHLVWFTLSQNHPSGVCIERVPPLATLQRSQIRLSAC